MYYFDAEKLNRYELAHSAPLNHELIAAHENSEWTDEEILDFLRDIAKRGCMKDIIAGKDIIREGLIWSHSPESGPVMYGIAKWDNSDISPEDEDIDNTEFVYIPHVYGDNNGSTYGGSFIPLSQARQDDLLSHIETGATDILKEMIDYPEFYEQYLEEPEFFADYEIEEMQERIEDMKEKHKALIRMFRQCELFYFLKEQGDARARRYEISLANTLEHRGITEELKNTDPMRYKQEKAWAEQQMREIAMYGGF